MNPLPHCPPPLPIVPIWGTALEYYSPEVRHTWAVTEPTAASSDVWCRETFWVTVYEVHTGEGRGEDIFEQNGQNFHGLHARIWNKFTNKTARQHTRHLPCQERRALWGQPRSLLLPCPHLFLGSLDSKKKSHKNVILANLIHIQRWFEMRLKSDFYWSLCH